MDLLIEWRSIKNIKIFLEILMKVRRVKAEYDLLISASNNDRPPFFKKT
jgi:hypothetical protein